MNPGTPVLVVAAGFAVPGLAIAGLAAALLPVIVHLLLRRRRRPIEWAAMDLLRQAIERRRRRLRLERLLLLAIRMAAVALLGAALARPFLDGAGGGAGSRRIWIVLDDGIATGVGDPDGVTAFDASARRTATWIEGRPVGDEIGVVLASRPPRVLVEPTADLQRVADRVEATRSSLAGTDLDAALDLVAERLAETPSTRPLVLIASDLREGSVGEASTSSISPLAAIEDLERIAWTPAAIPIDNVGIAEVLPGRPPIGSTSAPVRVELVRDGSLEAATTRVSLSGPRLRTAVERDVVWRRGAATASVDLLVPVPGIDPGSDPDLFFEVSIPPDDQPGDDRRFGLLDARSRIRVGISSNEDARREWFARALAPTGEIPLDLVPIEPALVERSTLRGIDALVVLRPDLLPVSAWKDLADLIDRGGVAIVAPPAEGGGVAWLDRLAEIVPGRGWAFGAGVVEPEAGAGRRLDPEAPHRGWLGMIEAEFVELAEAVEIERHLDVVEAPESEIVLRTLDDAPVALAATAPGGGSLVLLGVALDLAWTDLPVRPLVVPLVQELLREGLVRGSRRNVGLVGAARSPMPTNATALETPSGSRVEIRGGRLETPIDEPGRHEIVDAAGGRLGALVANVDAAAASTEPVETGRVAARLAASGIWTFADVGETDEADAGGETGDSMLSSWLLAVVIGLLVVEALLARRFSHVASSRTSASDAPAFLAAYGVGEAPRRTPERTS